MAGEGVRISDIIVPEEFAPYVINKTTEKSALFQSGIVAADERISIGSRTGGETVSMPFWNDIDGEAEELSDQKELTPGKIDAGQDFAVLQALGKAFKVNDLSVSLSGADPVGAIGSRVADFWSRNMQYRLISSLTGVFAAASMSGNVLDISGLTTNSGKDAIISKGTFADAVFKLGDMFGELSAVAMHSATYSKLYKDDLLETIKGSDGQPFPTYQGKRAIVDDGMPIPSAGVYVTYLFGAGAVGYSEGMPEVPAETQRLALASADILVSRRHFVLHPRGIKWTGAKLVSSGDGDGGHPTRAELATGTNWVRVYQPKQIRIVAFKHKLA
jgi:hypothetical protein